MLRLAVTGGSGFVGSRLTASADRYQLEISHLRRDAEGSWPSLLEGVDAVVHMASVVHRPDAPRQEYEQGNVELTERVLKAAETAGVRRFVHLSTIKVYGEQTAWMDEDTPLAPEGWYAQTKVDAETRVEASTIPTRLRLRLCPVYGVGDKGNVRTVLTMIQRGRFIVPGTGATRKSLVHVNKVVETIVRGCRSDHSGPLVVADPVVHSIYELGRCAAEVLGKRPPIRVPFTPVLGAAYAIEFGFRMLGRKSAISPAIVRKSQLSSVCDSRRATEVLGIDLHTPLREALVEEAAWLARDGLL